MSITTTANNISSLDTPRDIASIVVFMPLSCRYIVNLSARTILIIQKFLLKQSNRRYQTPPRSAAAP